MKKSFKPIRIIFDSTDKCGKTNIAKELSSKLDVPYFKNSNEFGAFLNMDSEYFVNTVIYAEPFFLDFIEQSNGSFIMDRGYPSEFVYSQAFDRETNTEWLRRIDEKYAQLNTLIIIPTRSSYVGMIDEESHGLIDSTKMELLDKLYRQFAQWTKCKSLLLNVDDEKLSREIKEIMNFIKENQ